MGNGKNRKRRKYTTEFRAEALRAVEQRGDRTISEVAGSLGVSESLLHGWRFRARTLAPGLHPDRGESPAEECQRLRRELATMTKERELLLKSIVVVARERK